MTQFIQGFLLQASLILALGAQNIFVLESGLRKRRHILVATVCSVCDFSLILIGVLGAATIFVTVPALKIVFGVLGVGFLFFYAFLKLKEAFIGNFANTLTQTGIISTRQVVMTTLGFSLLNPHVYLDTVILIGGYSSKFPQIIDRLFFGVGAGTMSVIWFFTLALSSAKLSRILSNSTAMRWIAFVSGTILLWLAFKLSGDLLLWISNYFPSSAFV